MQRAHAEEELRPDLARRLQEPLPAGASADSAAPYLRGLGERARPDPEAERRLIRAAQAGDRAAREALIEAFLPLIGSLARLYRDSPRIERVELLQEGVVGLLRALERYDADRGTPFWGYAAWWVRQAMQQLVAELSRPVVLSDRALRQLSRVKDAHRSHLQRFGREPTAAQLARAAGLSAERVGDLIACDRTPHGLEEPTDGSDGDLGTFGELLVDPLAEGQYERALSEIQIEQLRGLLSSLSERERAVLRARYGLGEPERTLSEIAERLGLSAERVRQIEQRALGKLRAAVGAE